MDYLSSYLNDIIQANKNKNKLISDPNYCILHNTIVEILGSLDDIENVMMSQSSIEPGNVMKVYDARDKVLILGRTLDVIN